MKLLRAPVRRVTGATIHSVGTIRDGVPVPLECVPDPSQVEIVVGDGGFFLFRLDDNGGCLADTWHETLDDAKAQAKFEYDIDDSDWVEA